VKSSENMKNMNQKITATLVVFLALTSIMFAQNPRVNVDQDPQIEKLLDFKKDTRTVETFKIQIFSGDRSGAERVKNNFSNLFNDLPVSMEFNTPNYKIWVGNFTNRLEAERALVKIKKEYTNAFIFKPKVNLKS
jgi:hypothetical protein